MGKSITVTADRSVKQQQLEKAIVSATGTTELESSCYRKANWLFDFSKTQWIDLSTVLWILSFLARLKRGGNELRLRFPELDTTEGQTLWSFLQRWQFFEALQQLVDYPINILEPSQVSYTKVDSKYSFAMRMDPSGKQVLAHSTNLLEITSFKPQGELFFSDLQATLAFFHEKFVVQALSRASGWELRETERFVDRVIREGVDNALFHAGGSFATLAMSRDSKYITIALGDDGQGIPAVLRNAFKRSDSKKDLAASSDIDLIKYFTEPDMILDSTVLHDAVKEGVTSDASRKGTGLYYLKNTVMQYGGRLRIRSGSACVDFSPKETISRDDLISSVGTVIRILTPVTDRR